MQYLKASLHAAFYKGVERAFSSAESLIGILLILIFAPFFLLGLFFAGTYALYEGLGVPLGWSFLIATAGVWLIMLVLFLLRRRIAGAVMGKSYKKMQPLMDKVDSVLGERPKKAQETSESHPRRGSDEQATPSGTVSLRPKKVQETSESHPRKGLYEQAPHSGAASLRPQDGQAPTLNP